MNLTEYLFYAVTVIVMIATPGPVMLMVASAGLKGGYKKALETILGTNLASLVLILLSILILKGVLKVDPIGFNMIKILGCLYIAYIGIQILREALDRNQTLGALSATTVGGFKQGFLVAISNPKDIIFFASFFPQFIHVMPDLNQSLGLLTATWVVLDFATLSLVYLVFNRLAQSKIYHTLLAGCGLILIVVALYGIYSTLLS